MIIENKEEISIRFLQQRPVVGVAGLSGDLARTSHYLNIHCYNLTFQGISGAGDFETVLLFDTGFCWTLLRRTPRKYFGC